MATAKKILVFGATGRQGGSVTNALLKRNFQVRGVTRNGSSLEAKQLRARGVDVVVADYRDHVSLVKTVKDADVIFFMTTPYEEGMQAEIAQGVALIEAARAVNPVHLVYSSVANADTGTGIPHFESKYEVEKHLAESGMPYTIIAPVFFMENILSPWLLENLRNGVLSMAMPPETALQQIAVENIGEFTAAVIDRGEAINGRRFDIAGDEITGEKAASVVSRFSGKTITFSGYSPELIRDRNEDVALMYEWFDRTGYSADIQSLREEFPEVPWLDYTSWAGKQDWSILD